jgi:hypothetical protein
MSEIDIDDLPDLEDIRPKFVKGPKAHRFRQHYLITLR